ncbi:ADP-ribosylation factor-like protein [Sorangium sp. So ce426]|uniref:Rab family GTPase n=1 Tax=Sorangium sp. So ce426 TaxID=3133312 RepID=UPI003F5CAC19
MTVDLSILFGLGTLGCGAGMAWLAARTASLRGQLRDADRQGEALRRATAELDRLRAELAHDRESLGRARSEERQKVDWLDAQQREIEWLRRELDVRPKITQKRYKILTLGVKGTGKTSLTLKWANPLVDLGKLQGTKIERYERTVSHVSSKDELTEHIFEIGDWGGEHIVEAQHELVMEEIHGLLMVVDLAAKDARQADPARIEEQIREFQPQSLRYFFGSKTLTACKAVVLFINKSDVLAGTPAEIEAEARKHYRPLIDGIERFKNHVDTRVLVGSASYGHGTHHLFSHFVERILPKHAYDGQLLQRIKQDVLAPAAVSQTVRLSPPQAPQVELNGQK